MKFIVSDCIYNIRFQHDRDPIPVASKLAPGGYLHPKVSTYCTIRNEQTNETVGFGVSHCSDSDNFNKAYGRKLSLTRALEHMACSRTKRTAFWRAYNNRNTGVLLASQDSKS